MTDVIHAAGAVIWRGDESSPEVAVVHRPKYDDWSFPKGKLKSGEHVIAGALREVREETGLSVVLGRSLPPVHYLKDGRLKRVDYWAARVSAEDDLTAVDEVDEVVWMSLGEARDRLTYEWDAGLLRALTAAPLVTVPLILVRHGLAGSRSEWKGHDDRRPLDADGLAQADVVAAALAAYAPRHLVSSPSRRCTQTLKPYATATGLPIRKEKLLSEPGYDPKDTLRLVRKLTEPTALCSHGKVLPDLLDDLSEGRIGDTHLKKGGFAVLHHAEGELVSVDRYVT
ncbi:NUDIX domain-containing protein [Herbidospora sp. NEAU-GS84]|uniref:NUDIX domain-containing protein n=1 Tax=Herbidospora solisilvae TaxID=2696284 RepID=A0A7C9J7B6_9ACTN|nr:NUDIX hydrolase [Herbidospora solisilvae]NAS26627.1 NUDIX domain-containing protein [Herbidospora solisilvae]